MKKSFRKKAKIEFNELVINSGIHPLKFIAFVLQLLLSTLTICLLLSFNITLPSIQLDASLFPVHFFTGSLLILLCSILVSKTNIQFDRENVNQLRISTFISIFSAIAFFICLFVSWKKLFSTSIYMEGSFSSKFFMLLCSTQLAYFFVAICLHIWSNVRIFMLLRNQIKSLLFFGNKLEKARIESLSLIWKFSIFNWFAIALLLLLRFLYN